MPAITLSLAQWSVRAATHRNRADAMTAGHSERARRGETHPVWDFLFSYYSLRPRQLRIWHPGYGIALGGEPATEYLRRSGYVATAAGVAVAEQYLCSRLDTVRYVAGLLRATAHRAPQFGCFGMHEWAMVYRAGDVRHRGVPLRLGGSGTDAVVESTPLRCSHFDAYRFFTADAAPLNQISPSRADQSHWEQPACLHANMDLYKWAYKLGPLIESTLLLDCLELAAQARELDMRASPYDLSDYGFEPITVEEPAGRAEYIRRQAAIAALAAPLRARLLGHCERLLTAPASSDDELPAGTINKLSLQGGSDV